MNKQNQKNDAHFLDGRHGDNKGHNRHKQNILFVCKHNRFRSKVAEAFFNKLNKNKNYQSSSAGLIYGEYPLDRIEVNVAKKIGLKLNGKPKPLNMKLLGRQDIVVIVADNIPLNLFNGGRYGKKKIVWKIPDVVTHTEDEVRKIINDIESHVKKFVESLK